MAQPKGQMALTLQEQRRTLLLDATIRAISVHGLSGLTLAKVGELAGLTAGTVSFHFSSKEALLLATLRHLAEEFESALDRALEEEGSDPRGRLAALVEANLDPEISNPCKVAVWYAFMAEAGARKDYQKICDDRDSAYYHLVLELCRQIIADRRGVDAEAVAYGLVGLIDQLWQEILFEGDSYDRAAARRRCRAFLASIFPWAFSMPGAETRRPVAVPSDASAEQPVFTLPSWIYGSHEFLALEKEHLFMRSWLVVCHVSDLPETGSWVSFQLLNERAFVVRDRDGTIRAWHNVCPHRAHSLVQGSQGQCSGRLTCPYHGWTFALDGRRIGVSAPETFPPHDRERFGLKPLECETLFGFVFLRFRPGGPAVAEQFAPLLEEFARYRTEDMVPEDRWSEGGSCFWDQEMEVDWKNAVENYVEDYHFPTGHKGLAALMEEEYQRQAFGNGVVRLSHAMRERPLPNWSVQRYHKVLPGYDHLPAEMQRRWTYFGLFPSSFFDLFPEKVDFMQMLPVAPGRMLLRGRCYALPDSRRESRAARYLSDRINLRVQNEDNSLTEQVQKGLGTSAYRRGMLSRKEVLVRSFQDWIRERIPAADLDDAPPPGTLAAINQEMSGTA